MMDFKVDDFPASFLPSKATIKWARDEANMKEILVGWCEEDQRIHVCFEVESMEVMQKFMETHAEVIASSGHKQETTVVKVLSDA